MGVEDVVGREDEHRLRLEVVAQAVECLGDPRNRSSLSERERCTLGGAARKSDSCTLARTGTIPAPALPA